MTTDDNSYIIDRVTVTRRGGKGYGFGKTRDGSIVYIPAPVMESVGNRVRAVMAMTPSKTQPSRWIAHAVDPRMISRGSGVYRAADGSVFFEDDDGREDMLCMVNPELCDDEEAQHIAAAMTIYDSFADEWEDVTASLVATGDPVAMRLAARIRSAIECHVIAAISEGGNEDAA